MARSRSLSPDAALRVLVDRRKETRIREVPVEDALGAVLAEDLDLRLGGFAQDPAGVRRALVDGYALLAECASGDERRLGEEAEARRVAQGDELESDEVCVVRARDVTLLGAERLRVEGSTAVGQGVEIAGARGARARLAAGRALDTRTLLWLSASGTTRLRVCEAPVVGLLGQGQPPPPSGRRVADLCGPWLEGDLRAAGLDVVPLGPPAHGEQAMARALWRARQRGASLVLIHGGTGDGIADRTGELLCEAGADVLYDRLALDLCPTWVLAKAPGIDIIAIPGAPRAASVAFDVLVLPFLLARAGFAPERWDWRERRVELSSPLTGGHRGNGGDEVWRAAPARRVASASGRGVVEPLPWDSAFAPGPLAGAGWVLVESDAATRPGYWVPVPLTASRASL